MVHTAKESGESVSVVLALMTVTIYMGYKMAYEQMAHAAPGSHPATGSHPEDARYTVDPGNV